jgi:hypothetical protein
VRHGLGVPLIKNGQPSMTVGSVILATGTPLAVRTVAPVARILPTPP